MKYNVLAPIWIYIPYPDSLSIGLDSQSAMDQSHYGSAL